MILFARQEPSRFELDAKCEDCIFSAHDGTERVECRRNPPAVSHRSDQWGEWPIVRLTDWCGEFEPAPGVVR